jgi:hypothetical protein
MVSSNRQAIACILLIFGTAFCTYSQTAPEKTATVTGKVTFNGKGIPGITVVASNPNHSNKRYKGTSDQLGNYRITNIPPGSYNVNTLAQSFVMDDERASRSLLLAEAETVEDVNFTVMRGGVITGKITDSDNEPLIEQQVRLLRVEDSQPVSHDQWVSTDDRGVYRMFGLRPGKYKVAVGQSDLTLPGDGARQHYKETFYPSVTDAAKATVIEVTEGGETSDVDIVVGRMITTYTIGGRIVDEEEKPLAKVMFGVQQTVGNSTHSSMGGITSNAQGEFRFEGVLPGKYLIFFVSENSDVRPDSLSVDVVDRDVTGLMIRTSKGASLSGVVVLEGNEERPVINRGQLYVQTWSSNSHSSFAHRSPTTVKPDGSFRIGGLRSGPVRLSIYGFSMTEGRSTRLGIVRLERNGGVLQPPEIEIKDGEQVSGLRVVVQYLTGAIRGVVKLQKDDLPPGSQFGISLSFADGQARSDFGLPGAHVDSRGRFSLEGLAAGTYDVRVSGTLPGGEYVSTKQQVTVTNNSVSEIVLTLETRKP